MALQVYTVLLFEVQQGFLDSGQQESLWAPRDDGYTYVLRELDLYWVHGASGDDFRITIGRDPAGPQPFELVLLNMAPGQTSYQWQGRQVINPNYIWASLTAASTGPDNYSVKATGYRLSAG